MKKLFSRVAVIFTLFSLLSCLQEELSPEEILVPSPAQVETSDASLMLTSKVPSGSEKLVYECGFFVSADKPFFNVIKVEGALNANQFTATFPVRDYGTTYYICAYVTNGHGSEIRSDLRTFQLEELEEYVEFGQVNMVSFDPSSKQLMITIDTDIWAGVSVSEAGVCYGAEPTSLSIEGDYKEGVYRSETRAEAGVIEILLNNFSEATQYYLRPYVKDGEYLSYGEVVPFYIPAVAKVSTFDADAVTASGATLSGEVTDECGSAVTERGFVWIEGDAVPTIEDSHMASGSGLGAMTATVEGLDPNKKYTFRAYATNASGTAYGEAKVFTTLVALPSLAASTISNITSTSATFNGVLANNGGESVSEVGFYYSTEKEVNPETAQKVSLEYSTYQKSAKELSANTLYSAMQSAQAAASDEGEAFSIDVFSLGIKTKYYVKSYAVNSAGVAYGSVVNFETAGEIATIKTVGSSEVTTSSAVLSANITTDNGEKITERGFVWMEGAGNPTTDSNKLRVSGEVGEYTATLEGLEPNKKYSFRAYATNSKGTAYGEIMTFSTVVGLPVLSTVDVADITATSAIVTADVKDKGGESITEVGFYYSTEETVDIESSVKVKKNYTGNAFSASLDELQIFADYYVKAYAVNSAGVAYSDVVSFKTLASTPVVNTVGASEITPTSAVLSGTVATDNGAAITERGFVYLKGTEAPTTSSNKVKVEGTLGDFTASLADLEPNQKYSYRAYAINAKGTSYGDIMNFSTSVSLPALSAMKVSSITTTSATFTCTVTNHGGETVSGVGFYYSKEESVDVETAQKISEVYSSDAFTLKAEDLEIGQNYYVKAYVKNSVGEAYSAVVAFKTTSTAPSVSTIGYTKLSATSAELSGQVLDDNGENITERGFVWVKGTSTPTTSSSKQSVEGTVGDYTATVTDLEPNQIYSFRAYAINSKGTAYGDVMQLQIAVTIPTVTTNEVTGITNTTATSGGVIVSDGGGEILAKGVVWSRSQNPTVEKSFKTENGNGQDSFTSYLTDLNIGCTYYVRAYATNAVGTAYGAQQEFKTTGESPFETMEPANSFIVSESGTYAFEPVKGNSWESVGTVASAEVLWESFGTSETPEVGSLVSSTSIQGDLIVFEVPEPYREGNAVIAAKDASGTILWSWHIWLTDQPQEHIYPNNAGTMMDRNLGATSATPGEVGALGLLYQWGRKDPFLGSSSIGDNIMAKSTISKPSMVSSNKFNGTIEYSVANPTTFIAGNNNNCDWYYYSSAMTDHTRWQSEKTIYDPCPVGWRVPDGGSDGIWFMAGFDDTTYDSNNKGISFSITASSTTWYPSSGGLALNGGLLLDLFGVGSIGNYWSITNYSYMAYYLCFDDDGAVKRTNREYLYRALSIRCFKEMI